MVGRGVEQARTNRVCFLLGSNKQLLEHESLLRNTWRECNESNFYSDARSNGYVNQYSNADAYARFISDTYPWANAHTDLGGNILRSKQSVRRWKFSFLGDYAIHQSGN